MRLMLAALAASLALPASASVDLKARRLTFDHSDGVYAAADRATVTLAYEATGSEGTLTEVFLRIEIGTDPATRITYIMNEVRVPSGPREFVMKVDLLDRHVPEGTFDVTATLDSKDLVRESDEQNNSAHATLVVGRPSSSRPPSSTAPPASTSTSTAGARRLAPREARTVSQTTCSALERAWRAPLEVGFHPGYGTASVSLGFDHPLSVPRTGERIRRSRLVIAGTVQGTPFDALGPLDVTMRSLGGRDASCATPRDVRSSATALDGSLSIDLANLVRDAESLPWECAARLQVVLSFPTTRTEPSDAELVIIDESRTGIDVEIEK
jgi:hypothetical protein